jgi:DNA polymerase-1
MKFDPTQVSVGFVETLDDASTFWSWVQAGHKVVGFDIETDGLDWYDGKIRLVQFGTLTEGWAIPYDQWAGLVRQTLDYLKEQGTIIVGHNVGGFDLTWARHHTGFIPDWSKVHDTMIAAALLDSAGSRALKNLSTVYVHPVAAMGQKALKEDMKMGGWDWATVPVRLPSYWTYGVLDTILTVNLFHTLMPLLAQYDLLRAYETERHVEKILHNVSYVGIQTDLEHCRTQRDTLLARCEQIQEQVQAEYGLDNIGSGPQLARAFEGTGVILTERTPSGNGWSMSADSLEIIAALNGDHPLVKLVTEYRKGQKYANTYYENVLKFTRSDGRCHPSYRQVQARTLRMSANDPPIQTWPRVNNDGTNAEPRNAFVASPGKSYISADFSNIEARVFAILANDIGMLEAFIKGIDLHCYTGGVMYEGGKILDKHDPRRQLSKSSLFLTLFGGGAGKLAVTAGISTDEAEHTLKLLKAAFPTIPEYSRQMQREAGDMELATGRSGVRLADGRILRMAEDDDRFYAYVNYSVQGTARMILAQRLIALDNAGLADMIVAVIHDEVILEVPDEDVDDVRAKLKDYLEDYESFGIPILASVGQPAKRLGEADH